MERHVSDARVLAETLEMRPVAARCHLRLAWLYQRIGRPESDRHAAMASSVSAHPRHDTVKENIEARQSRGHSLPPPKGRKVDQSRTPARI
jgi:hypothetical protein